MQYPTTFFFLNIHNLFLLSVAEENAEECVYFRVERKRRHMVIRNVSGISKGNSNILYFLAPYNLKRYRLSVLQLLKKSTLFLHFSLCWLKSSPKSLQLCDTRAAWEVILLTGMCVLYLLAVWLRFQCARCFLVYLPVPSQCHRATHKLMPASVCVRPSLWFPNCWSVFKTFIKL